MKFGSRAISYQVPLYLLRSTLVTTEGTFWELAEMKIIIVIRVSAVFFMLVIFQRTIKTEICSNFPARVDRGFGGGYHGGSSKSKLHTISGTFIKDNRSAFLFVI